MRFVGYRTEVSNDQKSVIINAIKIDDTELIYNDPDESARIRATRLFQEDEINDELIMEPHSEIIGKNVFMHGRLIIDAVCKAFLEVDSSKESISFIENLKARIADNKFDAPEMAEILPNCSEKTCTLRSLTDLEQFIGWIFKTTNY